MAVDDLELVGPTVVLRRPARADAEALWEAIVESTAEVGRWMEWCRPDYTRAEAQAWVAGARSAWARGEAFDFVVVDRQEGAVLGGCGVNQVDALNRRANLGYWVRTSATGRGVATEAAALAAHLGLRELGLGRLEIVVATPNLASQRVAAKLGAVREGVMRNRFWLQGDAVDAVLYSLVPSDLETDAARSGRRGPGRRGSPRPRRG